HGLHHQRAVEVGEESRLRSKSCRSSQNALLPAFVSQFLYSAARVSQMNSARTLAALFFSISIGAFGISFEPRTPCEWYAVHHGLPTFVGMAVSDETVSDVLRIGEHVIPVTVQKVTFRVEEPFESTPAG